jgi:hypothetical protein
MPAPVKLSEHFVGLLIGVLLFGRAAGEPLPKAELLASLRHGGLVILMRHASSPRVAPDAAHANRDNVTAERQLDDSGVASARAMGEALHRLHVPIGAVLDSQELAACHPN